MTAGDWAAVVVGIAAVLVGLAAVPASRARRPVMVASALLIALALGIGAWNLRSNGSAPTPSPEPDPIPTAAVLEVAPNPINPGQRYTIIGRGFRPGANVTVRSGTTAGTVGFDQADGTGAVQIVGGPADQSICNLRQDQLTAYADGEPVADVVVEFCT